MPRSYIYIVKRKVVLVMNSSNEADIIKNLINSMDTSSAPKGGVTENDIRQKIKGIDKNLVIKKLNSMGLGKAAQMLGGMSDEDIIREVSKNPAILKKLNSFLKGGR